MFRQGCDFRAGILPYLSSQPPKIRKVVAIPAPFLTLRTSPDPADSFSGKKSRTHHYPSFHPSRRLLWRVSRPGLQSLRQAPAELGKLVDFYLHTRRLPQAISHPNRIDRMQVPNRTITIGCEQDLGSRQRVPQKNSFAIEPGSFSHKTRTPGSVSLLDLPSVFERRGVVVPAFVGSLAEADLRPGNGVVRRWAMQFQ